MVVKHVIDENDVVEFLDHVGPWMPGTRGTVVSDHGDSKLIEVADENGAMLELIEVTEDRLRLVAKHGHG